MNFEYEMTPEDKALQEKHLAEWKEAEKKEREKKDKILKYVKERVDILIFMDIMSLIKDSDETYGYLIANEPKGSQQIEDYDNIKEIWVNQTTDGGYTGDEFAGTVSIRIQDTDEYFQYSYNM